MKDILPRKVDEFIECPQCKGTGGFPRKRHYSLPCAFCDGLGKVTGEGHE